MLQDQLFCFSHKLHQTLAQGPIGGQDDSAFGDQADSRASTLNYAVAGESAPGIEP